jgi:hypothetical protein
VLDDRRPLVDGQGEHVGTRVVEDVRIVVELRRRSSGLAVRR